MATIKLDDQNNNKNLALTTIMTRTSDLYDDDL